MKKLETYKVNEDHIIISPSFHDSLLKQIEVLDENTLNIFIQMGAQQIYKMTFSKVEYLEINNFKIENIILDIELFKQSDCSIEFLKEMLRLDNDKYLTKIANEINSGILMLVIINPSYGAELICLCKSFQIYKL